MKFFTNKQMSKKIILAILLVMSFNFISPTVSQADFGGALFKPISLLLCSLSDLVIKGLQKYFTGIENINFGGISEIESDFYVIRYSPGIIFSGKVAGLKVNFINAKESDNTTTNNTSYNWKKQGKYEKNELPGFNDSKFNKDSVYIYAKTTDNEWWEQTATKVHLIMTWEYNGQKYTAVNTDVKWNAKETIQSLFGILGGYSRVAVPLRVIEGILSDSGDKWTLYTLQETQGEKVEKKSVAYVLQDTVATWYKALRAISLVGLLSVLVYIGIRIIISSTGQEKAKYKKMIGDWLVAICILFVLQYIMIFITQITQKITDVLSVNLTGPYGEDTLVSSLRNMVGDNTDFSQMFSELIMYMVLVIYTVLFSIQYLKRVLYMAFFTMIAPLIALTYPLDKIKDGQAQAFTMWIREYTFNALLQPMHLLLYYIFVSSAVDLVVKNPLYAIVAIGFLLPAEKFFRKMFGFDKASSAGQFGAAAGGALIMNAINKMGHRSGKQAAGNSEGGNSSLTRTSSANSLTIGTGNGGTAPAPNGGPAPAPNGGPTPTPNGGPAPAPNGGPTPVPNGATPALNTPTPMTPETIGDFGSKRNASVFGPTLSKALNTPKGVRNGLAAVGRRYVNANTAKKAGRMARRGLLGAAGAATLGTVGLAAGVATGDAGNAIKYGAGGAVAGYMGANAVGDNVLSGASNIKETFKEGAIGQNEYNNLKADKEFYNSKEFRSMVNNKDLLTDKTGRGRTAAMRNAVQTYRDNGITDTNKIVAAMKKGLTPEEGAYAIKLADMITRSGWNNPTTRKDFETRYKSKIPGANGDKIWNSIEDLL